MEKLELNIEGMHCGSCATGIQMVTAQMEGVGSSFVDYNGKKGTILFDPAKTSRQAILKTIADLGYQAA